MFILVVLFIIVCYFYGTRTFGYWKKKGVKHDPPLPFFGNNFKQFVQRASMCMMATETYKKYPGERVVGFYRGTKPELVIRDTDLIKRILITDFNNFYARGFIPHKTDIEPLLQNLFFADGDTWRLIRQRFTPTFSTAKLKAMFPIITERAAKLQVLAEDIVNKDFYDIRELMARYTTDFIGACGFGLNVDALSDENSQFRWLGKRIFQRTPRDAINGALKLMFPELCKKLTFLSPELEKSVVSLVTSIMKERNYKPAGKNDFIDLVLEIKQKGKISGESIEQKSPDGSPKIVELEISDLLIIAQVFVFFGAGFETSSTASSYTLHQLAFNPDCQEKAQEEIDRVLAKYGNKLTYEAINDLKYLEMCFFEGMRMYPSVGYLVRMCTSPHYTFSEIDLTIDEGVKVYIPIQAINRDEKFFPNPNKFDPDRFRDGIKDVKDFFLPFGSGPRACVGERLGQMQSMAGIAALLHKYSLEPAACSVLDPPPEPSGIVSESFVGGLPLKLKKRHHKVSS
ncbi:cytochrome P450 6B2-like [Pectinophora gossypiella]|uniref:cytochrome P450 6B2-like n=1 Tax=Pectinophora gossypiella TaxID=13191 RepID=UPI00214E7AB5|nr:cytochrome P450 6B2-like [Pectinophora gossypiella]